MQEAAKIASLLSRKEITTVDMYNCMMALKLSRASYNYKEDNYLDLVAYIASLNDYQNNVQNEHSEDKKRKNTK
jgi:peroxiredoxin family protein